MLYYLGLAGMQQCHFNTGNHGLNPILEFYHVLTEFMHRDDDTRLYVPDSFDCIAQVHGKRATYRKQSNINGSQPAHLRDQVRVASMVKRHPLALDDVPEPQVTRLVEE